LKFNQNTILNPELGRGILLLKVDGQTQRNSNSAYAKKKSREELRVTSLASMKNEHKIVLILIACNIRIQQFWAEKKCQKNTSNMKLNLDRICNKLFSNQL
jgi:hypothetical protein